MIIEVKDHEVYIPEWNGNRDLPDDEQIKVHHRYFLPGERKKYIYTKPVRVDVNTGDVDSKVDFVQDEQGIVKALITKIENLTVKAGGKEIKVTNGEALYKQPVPQALVTEIEMYMLGASPEVKGDFLE